VSEITPTVFVFCALACEARPLIRAWQLKKLPGKGQPFAIYFGKDRVLTISGVGKQAMAGAVGYTLASFPDYAELPILLNVGIAGHPRYPAGTICLADKVVDAETGRGFFPQFPFIYPGQTAPLTTHAKPQVDYVEDGLYDMEASGFYEIAVKCASSELIHVVKIVSDNAETSIAAIDETRVETWMAARIDAIEAILEQLNCLRQCIPVLDLALYEQLLKRFHFSLTASLRLRALLLRWRLLRGEEAMAWEQEKPRSSRELLVWLEKQLENTDFCL